MSEEQLNMLMKYIDLRLVEAIEVSFQRPLDSNLTYSIDKVRADFYRSFGHTFQPGAML